MNVVDLHPEDLLDKEASGQLTESERERLASHVARCETCRLERQLRADFADEMSDDVELSPEQILAIVEGSAVTKPAAPAPAPAPLPVVRRSRRNMRMYMLVAAALLVGGVAGAGAGVRTWNAIVGTNAESPTAPEHPREAPPLPMPIVTTHVAPQPVPEPEPTPVAVVDAPAPPPAVLRPTLVPSAAPLEGAAALFDSAIEARRAGDYGKAIDLHRTLQSRYPKSREAHVSHGTIGRLLLDSGDASGALTSFDAYQSGGRGDLDEVVMVGRATALERLGRTGEARAAWSSLLESFPSTPYAKHARARLEATSAR